MMVSARLGKNTIDEISGGGILKMRDRLLSMQNSGMKVYRLETGDPSFAVPEHILDAITVALREGKTHYTESTGIPQLREAIAQKLNRKNNIQGADANNTVVTNGGMNAIYVIFRSLLSPADKVIIPDPMWTETGDVIKLAGGEAVPVPIDRYAEESENRIKNDERIRAIYINSPHNPTGKCFTKNEMKRVVDLAAEHNLWVVSDEAYEDVLFDGRTHTSLGSLYPNTISIYSMSKSYAMTGLRVGYAHIPDPVLYGRVKKLLRCTTNGINSATQYGAIAALKGPQDAIYTMRNEYQKRRDVIYAATKKNTEMFEPRLPEGAFYLWAKIAKYPSGLIDSSGMCEKILERTGIGSVPGPVFGPAGKDHIRFSFSASTEVIEEAAKIIENLRMD